MDSNIKSLVETANRTTAVIFESEGCMKAATATIERLFTTVIMTESDGSLSKDRTQELTDCLKLIQAACSGIAHALDSAGNQLEQETAHAEGLI